MSSFKILLFSFCISLAIKSQADEKEQYLKYWTTDIQIWYNSGGWYSLLNYYTKGDVDIALYISNKTLTYSIKGFRLNDYSYYDKGYIQRMRGGSVLGFLGSNHTICGYKCNGTYNYLKDIITCRIVMNHHHRLGYGSDIRYTFMKYGNGTCKRHLRRYTEAWLHTGLCYEKILLEKSGTIVYGLDSVLYDSTAVLTPFFPVLRTKLLTENKAFKDCIAYKATLNDVYIRAFKKDTDFASELLMHYEGIIPSYMIIDGKTTEFRCIQKDKEGNWLMLERYDRMTEEVIDTISRTIKYIDL